MGEDQDSRLRNSCLNSGALDHTSNPSSPAITKCPFLLLRRFPSPPVGAERYVSRPLPLRFPDDKASSAILDGPASGTDSVKLIEAGFGMAGVETV
jgi:hypothetical protein